MYPDIVVVATFIHSPDAFCSRRPPFAPIAGAVNPTVPGCWHENAPARLLRLPFVHLGR